MGTLFKWLLYIPTFASLAGIFTAIDMFLESLGLSGHQVDSATEDRIRTLRSKADDWDEIGRYDWADECRNMASRLEPSRGEWPTANKMFFWFTLSVAWMIIYFGIMPEWLRNGEF